MNGILMTPSGANKINSQVRSQLYSRIFVGCSFTQCLTLTFQEQLCFNQNCPRCFSCFSLFNLQGTPLLSQPIQKALRRSVSWKRFTATRLFKFSTSVIICQELFSTFFKSLCSFNKLSRTRLAILPKFFKDVNTFFRFF